MNKGKQNRQPPTANPQPPMGDDAAFHWAFEVGCSMFDVLNSAGGHS